MEKLIDMELDEIKQVEVDILIQIDEICKKNNLSYSVMDGTAIGMLRHGGFIPWDDDIDIMMDRKDYEKLKEIMTSNQYKDIKYISCETQDDYSYPFAKVVSLKTEAKEIGIKQAKDYGVFVDIFPIDNVPNDENERKRFLKKLNQLKKIHLIKLYDKQISTNKKRLFLKNIIALILKPIKLRNLTLKINQLMKKYEFNDNCNFVGFLYNDISVKKGKVYEKHFFDKKIYKKYENAEFMIVENYDSYLKDVFGNYMKLPPKEQQVSNHNWEILKWKNKV